MDNKQLFLKDGRLDLINEDDLRINFSEFCNSLLIIIHLYHEKLILYEDFTLKESIDDFIHHLLSRFKIHSNPLYKKRLEMMMKLNLDYSVSAKNGALGHSNDSFG